MKTEKEKMLSGELYDASDKQLSAERQRARLVFQKLNATRDDQEVERSSLIKELIPMQGRDIWIEPPFYCDYGTNIELGDNVFFNFNCVVLDVMPVKIGSNVFCAPGVQIYTAKHPVDAAIRREMLEYAEPVTIGDDVWLGGGTLVMPGVTIGARSVIGAGSVVTKDIPSDVVAVGNPCKVVRELTPEERT